MLGLQAFNPEFDPPERSYAFNSSVLNLTRVCLLLDDAESAREPAKEVAKALRLTGLGKNSLHARSAAWLSLRAGETAQAQAQCTIIRVAATQTPCGIVPPCGCWFASQPSREAIHSFLARAQDSNLYLLAARMHMMQLFFDAGLTRAHGELEALCPHVHLPLQSGSDAVLARMRRRYTRQDFLRVVEGLRAAAVVAPVGVHGLSQQRELPDAAPGQVLRLGHDRRRRAADLPAAGPGNDRPACPDEVDSVG